jgi:hypothetical protein
MRGAVQRTASAPGMLARSNGASQARIPRTGLSSVDREYEQVRSNPPHSLLLRVHMLV